MTPRRRFGQLREAVVAAMPPDDPVLAEAWWLVCNGCGAQAEGRSPEELVERLEGWAVGHALGDDDFCPRCVG